MGVQEFSTQLAEFNQAQIDAIEHAVDEVQQAVQDIKNTDLADLNAKLNRALIGKQASGFNVAHDQTVLSRNGYGTINRIYAFNRDPRYMQIILEIDGVTSVISPPSFWFDRYSLAAPETLKGWDVVGPIVFKTQATVRLINIDGTGDRFGWMIDYATGP